MLPEYLLKRIAPLCATLLLVSCGGGGGGGGGEDDNGGSSGDFPSSSNIPASAPSLPIAMYAGQRGPVDLDDTNVGAMADAMIVSFLAALPLANSIEPSHNLPELINETISGPDGGTARLSGRIGSDGAGWLSSESHDYTANGVTHNGLDVIEWLGPQTARRSFHNFQISSENFGTVGLHGHILRRLSPPWGKTVSGTMLYQDFSRGLEIYAEDFEITDTTSGGLRSLTASGRIFDERFGSVSMIFETPWQMEAGSDFPHHGGPMLGYGQNNRFLRMTSITASEVSLEFIEAGEQETTRAARLFWELSFEEETMSSRKSMPEVSAGPSRYYAPGAAVALDARFSRHLQNALLEFEWDLWFRPPGSAAELNATNTLRPTLLLDQPGRYLVRLSASDGERTAHDFVVLTTDPETYPLFVPVNAQFTPDEETSLGKILTIRRGLYTPQDFSTPSPQIIIETMFTGNGLVQTAYEQDMESFQATRPGVSFLELYQGEQSLSGNKPVDLKWVAVDTPLSYAPAVWFERIKGIESIAVLDLNGDGRDDIVTAQERFDPDPTVEIHYSKAPNSLAEPVVLHGGNGLSVALGDVTGDGRPDIVTSANTGLDLFVQQDDGTFAPPVNLGGPGCTTIGGCPILIGDVNGDNHSDIVATAGVRHVSFYLQNADGTIDSPDLVDTEINSVLNASLGDLDSDGFDDVAVAFDSPASRSIAILYGNSDGLSDDPEFIGPSFLARNAPGIVVGDIDGDGRDDLVFADSPNNGASTIYVYLQDDAGVLIEHQEFTSESFVLNIRLHDFDRDGRIDIGKIDSAGGIGVHYQGENGLFGSQRRELYGERARPLAVGDINADGLSDIIYHFSDRHGFIGIVFGAER